MQTLQDQQWQRGDWEYSWNANGSLKSVKLPDGEMVAFEYDALGRRIKKLANGKIKRYLWDGKHFQKQLGKRCEMKALKKFINNYKSIKKEYAEGDFAKSEGMIEWFLKRKLFWGKLLVAFFAYICGFLIIRNPSNMIGLLKCAVIVAIPVGIYELYCLMKDRKNK